MNELRQAGIDEFKEHFRGDVLVPGDAAYDDVRQIWNAMIDRRPALIARCTSPDDVVQAVRFARKQRSDASRSAAAATTSRATRCATAAS